MNIRVFQIIILVAVAFAISSCEDATINEQMDKAECLMNEKTDSALIILKINNDIFSIMVLRWAFAHLFLWYYGDMFVMKEKLLLSML